MECIILVGGMGTRLKTVVADRPKPMADVSGRPFLEWQLDSLISRGVSHFILATGFLGHQITNHFGKVYRGASITYSEETEPLGTGGAVLQALQYARTERVYATNGDTFCNASLEDLQTTSAELVMSVVRVANVERYGSVDVNTFSNEVERFVPKGKTGSGLINAGTYLIGKSEFLARSHPKKFSLETDYLPVACAQRVLKASVAEVPFIDIGIPEDYQLAQTYIAEAARLRLRVS
jgi:D-glycero-alpha-D-manno-heptose 1-phosphate guanylyltransferase